MRSKSFGAIANRSTRVMILGSLPGNKSLEVKQYYAHPTNQFWRLTGALIGQDLPNLTYSERLHALLEAKIGLWDVVASAHRKGSLDTAIRDIELNRLDTLRDELPDLQAIAFNGSKAAKTGRKQLPAEFNCAVFDLPSSSASYCAVTFDWKRQHWDQLKTYL